LRQTSRALLVGRFQPIHNGHISVIKQILAENDEIVIAVGSAQLSHTLENPLTAGERVYLIQKALSYEGIDLKRAFIITVPDIQFNSVWPTHVKSYAPPFDTVYTDNSLVATLFTEAGIRVKHPELYMREKCSGTNIRRLLLSDNSEWKKYVPNSVVTSLQELGIQQRLKSINRKLD
jgi:nicotinamide-nucleotide adenylyltransferase